jgi:DNA-binding transcriptional MerR regulator
MYGPLLSIGELSLATGVATDVIRQYERQGLMDRPARSRGHYRIYDQAHRRRLTFVHQARFAGFTIEQIRSLVDLADAKLDVDEAVYVARRRLDDIERKMGELAVLRDALLQMLDADDPGPGHLRELAAGFAAEGA